jgi:HlyD family secretion protein
MTKERKQLDRRWLWIGVAVLLILVFFSVRSLTRERLPVRVVQVTHESLESTVRTSGRVEPEMNYEIHSPIATIVKAVYVQPGDHVQKGKLLMLLDDVEARARLATAQSTVKDAEAALDEATHNGTQEQQQMAAADVKRGQLDRDQARRDLNALLKLNSTGAASLSEVAAARQRLETAEANLHASEQGAGSRYSPAELERAKAALADAEANLAAARQVVSQTAIHAPVAGTVYTVNAGRTEFVQEGALLLQLADLRQVRVRAYFDEPEIGRLAVGQPIQIKWDARQGQVWHGHIERTPVTVMHLETRSVGEVLVKIDDVDSHLLPDTNVTVTATTANEANVLSLPREALHSENGKPYVYKVVNNSLRRTPVVTGTYNMTQIAVLSGLKDGDWVATGTASAEPLQEGIPIKVVR